ncbi:MAG: hypothetical protein LH615_04310 [Ferruginibacter sp.]|nr:hypothetical protein [Ferruginibacter sp.]
MKLIYTLPLLFLFSTKTIAQSADTEFPKGFIMHAKLHNGMITNFKNSPDLYVGGLQFIPQVTLIEHKLRGGFVAGGFYGGKQFEGQFGPTVSVKLKTINAGVFGSAANVHATVDHLWGTGKQKLIGGGLHIDLLNKLVLGFTTHREYQFNTWWLQTAFGIKLSKTKKIKEPFNE